MKQFDFFAGRQLSRRQLLSGTAAMGSVIAAAGLAGCGGNASAAAARDIQFWHLLSGGDGIKMQAMINKANEANPGFKVHPTVLAWGPPYYTKLAMASAGGRPCCPCCPLRVEPRPPCAGTRSRRGAAAADRRGRPQAKA